MFERMNLKDRVAIITGASRGIGAEIAGVYAQFGAKVIIVYQGSVDKAEKVKDEILAAGGTAEALQCDVSDFIACEALVKDVYKRYKRIDILVNNAGITRDGLLMAMSEEDYDKVLDTNLKGAFAMTRFVSRFMMKQHYGKIINMTSVTGVMGNAGQANYAASKAGLIGLTKSVARELASRNITANCIAPGFIETDMTEALSEDVKAGLGRQIPLGRFGSAEDVANAALFLALPLSDYMTGQVIFVDGGMAI